MNRANPHLAARRAQKAALLPRAAELAAKGRSYPEVLDENRGAREAGPDAGEDAADEDAGAAYRADAVVEKVRRAEERLNAVEHASPAFGPAIVADARGGAAAGSARPVPLSRKESGSAATDSERLANGSPTGTPRDRSKSFPVKDLPLPGFDFASVRRSATLPNEVVQKGGVGKGRKKAKRGRDPEYQVPRRSARPHRTPRRGSAATVRRELDRALDGQGPAQSFPGSGGDTIGGLK